MRKQILATALCLAATFGSLGMAGSAWADDVKTVVGPITKITLAADGKSAVAVLKDGKSGEAVSVNITDDLTLDKFKDKRIVVGDEIRTKFDAGGGKNQSKFFKKTAGC